MTTKKFKVKSSTSDMYVGLIHWGKRYAWTKNGSEFDEQEAIRVADKFNGIMVPVKTAKN